METRPKQLFNCMNFSSHYRPDAIRKSTWHPAPKGTRYRFLLGEDYTPNVEWEGITPPVSVKSFWQKYARLRDDFIVAALPNGMSTIIVCLYTLTVRTLIGKGGTQ
jgi:hypothetical protein